MQVSFDLDPIDSIIDDDVEIPQIDNLPLMLQEINLNSERVIVHDNLDRAGTPRDDPESFSMQKDIGSSTTKENNSRSSISRERAPIALRRSQRKKIKQFFNLSLLTIQIMIQIQILLNPIKNYQD